MDLQSKAVLAAQAARPLRHWSEAALERARGHVEAVWSAWCDRWQFTGGDVRALNASDAAAVPAASWARVATHPLWLSTLEAEGQSPAEVVEVLLFGRGDQVSASARIAQDVAAESMADLVRGLSQLVNGNTRHDASTGEAPPLGDARRWSGALVVQLLASAQGRAVRWTLHCGETVASNLCGTSRELPFPSRTPLIEVTEALQGRRLTFNVCLQRTPLTLGALQMLRIGDVLPLAHRLDQPLRIVASDSTADTPPFCAAYLGSRDNFRAVELVPAASDLQSSTS